MRVRAKDYKDRARELGRVPGFQQHRPANAVDATRTVSIMCTSPQPTTIPNSGHSIPHNTHK
jgi:hypothetical protein